MKPKGTPIHHIVRLVAIETHVAEGDVLSERREKHIVKARHLAMWLARKATPLSTNAIGEAFDRDHTTVMYGIRITDKRRDRNPKLKDLSDALLAKLQDMQAKADALRVEVPA